MLISATTLGGCETFGADLYNAVGVIGSVYGVDTSSGSGPYDSFNEHNAQLDAIRAQGEADRAALVAAEQARVQQAQQQAAQQAAAQAAAQADSAAQAEAERVQAQADAVRRQEQAAREQAEQQRQEAQRLAAETKRREAEVIRLAALEPVDWREAVTLCSPHRNEGEWLCVGPLQSIPIYLDKPGAGAELVNSCGSIAQVRDLGMTGGYRAFGCGFGKNPRYEKENPPNRLGVGYVPGQIVFRCPKTANECQTQ